MTRLPTLRSPFFIYPDHAPGLGLALLRALAGTVLIWSGYTRWMAWQEPRALTLAVSALALASGLFLLLGYLTSLVCLVGVLVGGWSALFPVAAANPMAARLATSFAVIIALALFSLGPGAYSLDARRHGRREIIIPLRERK